jgi:glycosyltransferase involved in cell wall biosynthesis
LTRVLVIEAAGNLWGSERALLDLLQLLPKSEVAVCCPPRMPLNVELEKLGIFTLPYYICGLHQKSKWRRVQAAAAVLRACLEFRPDVIYLNQCGSYRVALPAATVLDLPLLVHLRIFEDASYLAMQCPSPRRLRGLIAISSAIEREVRRFRQLDAIQLHRIYDGYVPSRPALQDPERIMHRIACVGRIVPIKGQDVLVDALSMLNGSTLAVECLFLGEGDESFIQRLKARAESVNSGRSIQWLGFSASVIPLLRTCSVLVCPSHSEPLGRVIFEAWDAGVVPVVFSGSGGAAEIVAAAKAGVLYHEQTPQSLACALRGALELSEDQRARLVNNGRFWIAENCSPTEYAVALSTIFANARTSKSRLA